MVPGATFPDAAGRNGWPWALAAGAASERTSETKPRPKITVVTPSFNQGRFIEETIRSVLIQGYPNLEYIIIDGGSTDDTVETIQKYEPWISYWVSEKDRGQCHAINKGFARATGDILAWLCSDDVYAPGALHLVADCLAPRRLSMVVGAAIITHGPDSLDGILDRRRPTFADMAYNVKTLPQPSTFWTRDLWDAAGPLPEDLYFAMDYHLWLRMLPHAQGINYVEDVLSYERRHPDQKGGRTHFGEYDFQVQRVRVAWEAARSRGESNLGWVSRVWWFRLRLYRGRFWCLRGPGYHWEAARYALGFGRGPFRRQAEAKPYEHGSAS